jgi:metal-dependent amidase/aminoacylase/carboxypeptidase family protein
VDPVVIASKIVLSLQTIVSREQDPREPTVITVGSIHGGTKHNVIPDKVELRLTVRTYSQRSRERVKAAILRIAEAEAKAAGAKAPQWAEVEGTHVAVSDRTWTTHLVRLLKSQRPADSLVELPPEMGSEDFSEYAAAGMPTVMLFVGTGDPGAIEQFRRGGAPPPSLHSSRYRPAPGALRMALEVELLAAWAVLGKGAPPTPRAERQEGERTSDSNLD